MKTLDEVIESQERCGTYPDCHFCYLHQGPICGWIRDALHYLKEYRAQKEDISNWWIEQRKNPPLTWDELKQMEGKPVWVEEYWPATKDDEEDSDKYWAIMDMGLHKIHVTGENCDQFLYQCDMGNNNRHQWQAYRKERG